MKTFLQLLSLTLLLSINIHSQRFQWGENTGGTSNDYGRAVAVTDNGDIYLTGHFSGTNVDFDPGPGTLLISSKGGEDIFLAKYDSLQHCIWAVDIGGSKDDISMRLLLDDNNNIYIAGWLNSVNVDFDPGPGTHIVNAEAEPNLWFAKFSGEGQLIWVNVIGGNNMAGTHDITLDNNGKLLVCGFFCGTNVNFNPKGTPVNLSSVANSGDIFFAKYDTAGICEFAKCCSGAAYEVANVIRSDNSGSIYISGAFNNSVDFDPGPGTAVLTSAGGFDFFFSKYSPGGDFIRAGKIGGTGIDNSSGMYFDGGGNLNLSLVFSGQNIDFDPGPGTELLNSHGGTDIGFVKFDTAGNFISAKSIGGTGDDNPGVPSYDSDYNVFYCGYFSGYNVDFDPGTGTHLLSSNGAVDIFISEFDSAGNLLWAESCGSDGNDYCSGSFIDSKGFLYVTGQFTGFNIDFNPGIGFAPLTSHGGWDIFLVKYSTELKKEYMGLAYPDTIPQRFGTPDLISDGTWGWHSAPVFSPDGTKMIFTKYYFNLTSGNMKMYEMDDINGVWTEPYRPSYASDSSETSPVFIPDGSGMIFLSRRTGLWKYYFVTKNDTGWSAPQLLNFDYGSLPGYTGLNFSLASNGTMYLDMEVPEHNAQICKATLVNGTYSQFEILPGPVNTEYEESAPFIAPDQKFIMFMSNEPGSIGLHDIYISFRKPDNTWSAVQNMGNRINGNNEDAFPLLSPEGRFMFFVSAKQNDLAYNAYWVSSDVIDKLNSLVSVDDESTLPARMYLYQNYPNPFNPVTTIKYSVPVQSKTSIVIYDALGRKVTSLLNEEQPAGSYEAEWNAQNLPSGIYFYQFRAGDFIQTRKMILLK